MLREGRHCKDHESKWQKLDLNLACHALKTRVLNTLIPPGNPGRGTEGSPRKTRISTFISGGRNSPLRPPQTRPRDTSLLWDGEGQGTRSQLFPVLHVAHLRRVTEAGRGCGGLCSCAADLDTPPLSMSPVNRGCHQAPHHPQKTPIWLEHCPLCYYSVT